VARQDQPPTLNINTIAGGGIADGGSAQAGILLSPTAIAVDASGNVFIADTDNHRIRKIDPMGVITTAVGSGVAGFAGDGGPPAEAQLNSPRGLAFDKDGNLMVADTGNSRIRRLEKVKVMENDKEVEKIVLNTFAGSGVAGFTGDGGAAKDAQLNNPRGIVVDPSGNVFIADTNNQRVRQIDGTLKISTVAGDGMKGFKDEVFDKAQFNSPTALGFDKDGNLLIVDTGNNRIRRVVQSEMTKKVETVAGTGLPAFAGDNGPPAQAALNIPLHIVTDPSGAILIADAGNNRIRKIDPSGMMITTVVGTGVRGVSGDGGPAPAARLNSPTALALMSDGQLLVADTFNNRVRSVDSANVIMTIAGGGIGDGNPPLQAALNLPYGVATDAAGNIYFTDTYNHRIRKFSATEMNPTITTIAGTGIAGFAGDDGMATAARLNFPRGIIVTEAGDIYFADTYNHRVRKISASGVITTVAGNGTAGFSGDMGMATQAALRFPLAMILDSMGSLYIADAGNHRVRKVDAMGVITTVVGTGVRGPEGDDKEAVMAQLNTPAALAFDKDKNLLIADAGNHKIRKLEFSSGKISTVVGKGTAAYSGDGGMAKDAEINTPLGLVVDPDGKIYIADTVNQRVRLVDAMGNISNFAGNGTPGFGGDGQIAGIGMLNFPAGLAVDKDKNLLIADTFNSRIRKIAPAPMMPPPS
jgi:sugar lactone lactonase YvrE